MLPRWVQVLLAMVLEAATARRNAQIQFLKLQVQILRQKVPGSRLILAPQDRLELLRRGRALNHAVDDVLSIVSVKTYRRWLREQGQGRKPGRVGRPSVITRSVRSLILRLAGENPGWGVRRIVGELRKLTLDPSRGSVRRILVEGGVLPDPSRHAPRGVVTPWRTFVAANINSIVATDFFCKEVWTPLGRKVAHVLIFIHLGSRKVLASPATFHPTAAWMRQQARNVSMWVEEESLDLRYLIHDRDAKFTAGFDQHFRFPNGGSGGGGVIETPHLAPMANCYAESWIGSFKRECLNHLFCLSLGHLDHITQSYVSYYNRVRPHQGVGNVPLPQARHDPPMRGTGPPTGRIQRRQWLGGLLNHYCRQAA